MITQTPSEKTRSIGTWLCYNMAKRRRGWVVSFLRSRHGAAAVLLFAASGSWGGVPRAGASPPAAGYAEVAAPPDATVMVEPRPTEHHAPSSYAIETDPGEAAHRAAPQARPDLATLPAGPPLVVVIRFDGRRQNDAASAAVIAASLAGHGIEVRELAAPTPPLAEGIGFVFTEDREAAEALVRLVPGALGHMMPTRLDPRSVADPQPGLIQITLGEDRSTS